jgi:hypothetical protein
MRDIHAHWSTADVLVYSPVITAGCSFELPHFDEVFFYGCAGVGSVRSAIQMLARVRDVSAKTVHVYLAKTQGTYRPVNVKVPESMHRTPASRKNHKECYVDLLRLLEEHQVTENACAQHAFAYYFWVLVRHSGAQIVFPADRSAVAVTEAIKPPAPDTAAVDVHVSGPKEHWWCHNWTTDQHQALEDTVEHALESAIAVTGTLMERVNKLHPDHLIDLGYVPHVSPLDNKFATQQGNIFPAWCGPDSIERVRAWILFMARKSAAVAGCTAAAACVPGEWRRPQIADHNAFRSCVVHHPPISSQIRAVKAADVAERFAKHLRSYMDPHRHWMDTTIDAWVLAAAEVSLRNTHHSHALTSQRLFEPMPSLCITEAMLISSKVHDALHRYDIDRVHVNAAAGMLHPAVSRSEISAAVIDFIITDKSGNVHLLHMRADNAPTSEHARDIAKLCVLAAAEKEACGKDVASVAMLYLDSGVFVHLHLPTNLDPKLQSLATSGTSYVRAWNPDSHAGFVVFDADAWHVLTPSRERKTFACIGDLEVYFASVSTRRWISWGACRLGLKNTYDLESQLGASLRSPADVPLDLNQCTSYAPVANRDADMPDQDHPVFVLKRVYRGICLRRFLIFFWNGKPHALSCASLVLSF